MFDELVHGKVFAGRTVELFYRLPADFTTRAGKPDGAVALVYTTGGSEGLDRVDRATLEVYAPGTDADDVAEAIRDAVAGDPILWGDEGQPHDLEAGYVDGIRCDVTPHEVPFPSDSVRQVNALYLVTSRQQ
ncbi:hypothetical protein [Georgenia thermotolerans]|uniref:hypothetical protein n=1 Tax=Georgenia thermotolerans TaxID=527326 RepID=UPI0012659543|nr:hypothetical protein [Georgenia thermotolerans]